jgi:hypothetical protein
MDNLLLEFKTTPPTSKKAKNKKGEKNKKKGKKIFTVYFGFLVHPLNSTTQ